LDRNYLGQSHPVQTSLLPNIPLVPKTFGVPTKQQVFLSGQNKFHTQFKIPRNIMHEWPHSRNPRHAHLLPCVGPYENTCNNFRPFFDILSTTKVFLLGFFWFQSFWSSFTSTYLQHPQNQNPTTLLSPYWKASNVTCLLSLPSTYLTSSACIKYFSLHLISLLPQNPPY